MANQRSKNKAFVSAWIDKDLKKGALAMLKLHGFSGATDFIEVSFQRFMDKPYKRPRQLS